MTHRIDFDHRRHPRCFWIKNISDESETLQIPEQTSALCHNPHIEAVQEHWQLFHLF
jgi:hypothetical protein